MGWKGRRGGVCSIQLRVIPYNTALDVASCIQGMISCTYSATLQCEYTQRRGRVKQRRCVSYAWGELTHSLACTRVYSRRVSVEMSTTIVGRGHESLTAVLYIWTRMRDINHIENTHLLELFPCNSPFRFPRKPHAHVTLSCLFSFPLMLSRYFYRYKFGQSAHI